MDQGSENLIVKRLQETVRMPEAVATIAAEKLATQLSADKWQDAFLRNGNNETRWGKFALRTGDQDEPTPLCKSMSTALAGLQTSEVFMDQVLATADKLQAESGHIDWETWMRHSERAAAIARFTTIQAMNDQMSATHFSTEQEAKNQLATPEGNLTLIAEALGDAYLAQSQNFKFFFEDATHPAIVELAKRRAEKGELNAITPPAVVKDLGVKFRFGQPAK
jgi:hypothetical protein